MNEDLEEKIRALLRERLKKGNMSPFYKIGDKMQAWMYRNAIRAIPAQEWYDKYSSKTKPAPEGYVGVLFYSEDKMTKSRWRKKQRKLISNVFHLEIPTELLNKALVLGSFP